MVLNPLHVAVIVKNTAAAFERDHRNMGCWSYEVESFTWEFLSPGKGSTIDLADLKARGFDILFHEDGGAWASYKGDAIPTIYYSIDSTLTDDHHYAPRLKQAKQADLVLVDHDRLERFTPCRKPVRRFSHCVNDHLFKPAGKSLDIAFQCGGSAERGAMRIRLHELSQAQEYSYRSGAVSLSEYAETLGRAKVVVNLPRVSTNRPHRTFDAMACGAALVTTPLPDVSDEKRTAGIHYLETTPDCVEEKVRVLLENHTWQLLGEAGYQLVLKYHTWAVRARELRALITSELGI